MGYVIGTGIGAMGAAFNAVRWMHSTRPEAHWETKFWFALCAASVLLGVFRFIYHRNRRDYFAEEMDHRRSLAKGR
jgi:hypothetical protein